MAMKIPEGIRKKGRIYYGRWYDSTGRLIERALGPDLREAAKLRVEYVRNVRRARANLEDEVAIEAEVAPLWEEYVRHKKRTCTPRAAKNMERQGALMIKLMGVRRLNQITTARITKARDEVLDRGVAHGTANGYVSAIQGFSTWLQKAGRVARPLFGRIEELPTAGRFRMRIRRRLSIDECRALTAAANKTRVGDLFAVVLGTGMRLGEACALRWSDWRGRSIDVREDTVKTSAARTVSITTELEARLQSMRETQGAKIGRLPHEGDFILVNSWGKQWKQPTAYVALRQAALAADVPHVAADGTKLDWHALRHTHATLMAEHGATESQLMKQLGWASASMAQIYVDRARARVEEVMDRMPTFGCSEVGNEWARNEGGA